MYTKNLEIENKINDLIEKMTLHEKVGQLNQVQTSWEGRVDIVDMLKKGEIGGFLTGSDRVNTNRLQKIAVEESRLGIPVIFGRDVIHGHRVGFPDALTVSNAFNPELVQQAYAAIADEASANGVHWTFSPMLDIAQDPRWGRVVEGPGEDPYLGSKNAAAMVKGFQGETKEELASPNHIAACAKHYIAYGGAEGGRDYNKAEVSDYTLRNTYLPTFKSAVDAGVQTVMSSFNEISGQPVTSSHYLLTEVLRDELGFGGYVVSDDWSVKQLERQAVAENQEQAAVMALEAGVDMDMDDLTYISNLENAVEKGLISIETIDEAVRRILRVKFNVGLFDHPYIEEREVDYEAHKALERKVAGESIVLLKNNGVLPLAKDERFFAFGSALEEKGHMMGAWACDFNWEWCRNIIEGIKEVAPNADFIYVPQEGQGRLKQFYSKRYDTILMCLEEASIFEGEACNLCNIDLPEEQVNDIVTAKQNGKKVIVVFAYGRPMGLAKVEPFADAIIWAGRLGTMAGPAIADVLFGDVNPSGKMAITLPRTVGQLPLYYRTPQSCRPIEEYYKGESHLDNYRDEPGYPVFPFGYGISYTTFEYSEPKAIVSKLSLDEVKAGKKFKVSCEITNTGDREGKEIVQCYIRDLFASATRPVKELKGFSKENYKPGETKTIEFELGWDELAFYHFNTEFYPEPGEFNVFVGPNCYAEKFVKIEITK